MIPLAVHMIPLAVHMIPLAVHMIPLAVHMIPLAVHMIPLAVRACPMIARSRLSITSGRSTCPSAACIGGPFTPRAEIAAIICTLGLLGPQPRAYARAHAREGHARSDASQGGQESLTLRTSELSGDPKILPGDALLPFAGVACQRTHETPNTQHPASSRHAPRKTTPANAQHATRGGAQPCSQTAALARVACGSGLRAAGPRRHGIPVRASPGSHAWR